MHSVGGSTLPDFQDVFQIYSNKNRMVLSQNRNIDQWTGIGTQNKTDAKSRSHNT